MLEKFSEILSGRNDSCTHRTAKNANVDGSNRTPSQVPAERYSTWQWGGKWRMVPQGFQFPKGAQLKTMWDLWFYGHGDLKIRPYKELERYLDDLQTAAEKV